MRNTTSRTPARANTMRYTNHLAYCASLAHGYYSLPVYLRPTVFSESLDGLLV